MRIAASYDEFGDESLQGGFDLVAQGFAGLMAITGEPGRPPVKTGGPVSDINAGILAAQIIGLADQSVAKKLEAHKEKLAKGVEEKSKKLQASLKQ